MDIAALEDYLRRYPSGYFAELAQLQLDRELSKSGEKKIVLASQEGNPYTKGSAVASTDYRLGDSYVQRVSDMYTGVVERTFTSTVVEITDTEVIFDNGMATDLLGNVVRLRNGFRYGPRQIQPLEFAVGRRWTTRFDTYAPNGYAGVTTLELQIVARETITVPAGTFDTFRIEGRGYTQGMPVGSIEVRPKLWMAPGKVRVPIRREDVKKAPHKILASERFELVSFKQA